MTDHSHEYELIFEGPGDSSIKTLQVLKGIFIADLEFSISEVQTFLTKAPLTIKKSTDKEKLELYYNKLKGAGAKVLLLAPKNSTAATPVTEHKVENIALADNDLWAEEIKGGNDNLVTHEEVVTALPDLGEILDLDFEAATPAVKLPAEEDSALATLDLTSPPDSNKPLFENIVTDASSVNRQNPVAKAEDDSLFAGLATLSKTPPAPAAEVEAIATKNTIVEALSFDLGSPVDLLNAATSPETQETSTAAKIKEVNAAVVALGFDLESPGTDAPASEPAPLSSSIAPIESAPAKAETLNEISASLASLSIEIPESVAVTQEQKAPPTEVEDEQIKKELAFGAQPISEASAEKSASPAPTSAALFEVEAQENSAPAPAPATPSPSAAQVHKAENKTAPAVERVKPASDIPLDHAQEAEEAEALPEIPRATPKRKRSQVSSDLAKIAERLSIPLDIVVPVLIGAFILFVFHVYSYYNQEKPAALQIDNFASRPVSTRGQAKKVVEGSSSVANDAQRKAPEAPVNAPAQSSIEAAKKVEELVPPSIAKEIAAPINNAKALRARTEDAQDAQSQEIEKLDF